MSNNGHKKALHFTQSPKRVVSLVPSLTESLFELGLGSAVVGITDYCVHPIEALGDLPRLGGPKNPHLDDIVALQPDLVLANQEENNLQDVEALEARNVPVWVTFPKTVRQAMDVLWKMVELFRDHSASIRLQTLELTLDWAESSLEAQRPFSYFCPIWQDITNGQQWWMTFDRRTYLHDVLRLMGGQNVFADRKRRYPLEADLGQAEPEATKGRDTRYPRVTLEEIRAAQLEAILLPSEPFAFGETHRQTLADLLADTPAARNQRILLLDGSLITWHGTRLARALRDLPGQLGSA